MFGVVKFHFDAHLRQNKIFAQCTQRLRWNFEFTLMGIMEKLTKYGRLLAYFVLGKTGPEI